VIVAVASWRGTGATTTALITAICLAAATDDGAWLIEADPAGGVLAGRVEAAPHCLGGLERVAFPTERASVTESFAAVAHVNGSIRTVLAPADPFRAFSCHQPRMPWASSLGDLPGSVVVDVGTLRAGSPVWPVLTQADVVLLVASPEVSSAVAAGEWVSAAGRVSPADPGLLDTPARIVFVESPSGVTFAKSTLLAELGDQCCGWLPWEPSGADLVYRGAGTNDRRLRRSSLMGAAQQMVQQLTGVVPVAQP
jgi:hypothetical protein